MKLKLPTGYEEVIEDLGPDVQDILGGLDEKTIIELKKTVNGQMQAALMWYKQSPDILGKKLSFKKTGEIIVCLFVDASAMMGKEKVLDKTEKDLKTYCTVTEEEMLNYEGCEYIMTSKGITPATFKAHGSQD